MDLDTNRNTLRDDRQLGREAALPLEARVAPESGGWVVRLPVRAELIQLEKTVAVYERVVVREEIAQAVAHPSATVRREELRIETRGDLVVGEPVADRTRITTSGQVDEAPPGTGEREGRQPRTR